MIATVRFPLGDSFGGVGGLRFVASQDIDRNDMLLGVAREFLSVLDGTPVQTCAIADGVGVL